MMRCMAKVIVVRPDGERRSIGSLFQDGGGFVAWDARRNWLGKSLKSRFPTMRKAVDAILAAAGESLHAEIDFEPDMGR